MSLATMSPRDRRALTLGLLVLAPGLFFVWGVKPYRAALENARAQYVVERETLSRERAAIAAARANPDLQRVADSAMRAMTPRLFEGRDDVMATAELVSHLGWVAAEHHVWLQEAATRPTVVGTDGVRHLRVEIRAESDLEGVMSFLQALERGEKLLRVERLDLSRGGGIGVAEGVEPLAIAASIVGFAVPDAPAQANGGAVVGGGI